jgi:membrane peptidoglycan carboxypeptidase
MKKLRIIILLLAIMAVAAGVLFYPVDNSRYIMNRDLINQISSTVPNYVTIDKIPEGLKNAVVAVEDKRFYKHFGIDVVGIGRAVLTNIRGGGIKEGGSTITQQLAKNMFLSADKSYLRKLREALFAVEIETIYDKDQILEMYLNEIYYGSGAYGVQNASREFFNKDVTELTLAECAMLAGLPQAPSAYNPKIHFDRAKKRQESVLEAMADYGYDNSEINRIQGERVIIAN